ncbi:MAG: SET domain-containing protein-lysine N-methyltransferase, partial [Nitrospirales bacterium]|nr:SET domain-containing protein-lysine N-methyltransferase [Nitrospirales bacterium]
HAGGRIAFFEGDPTPHITKHSLTLEGENVEPTGELKHLNHSCDPNAYFLKRWLMAGRDIQEGDEITIDYALTEDSFSDPFPCNCGAEMCRGRIQ